MHESKFQQFIAWARHSESSPAPNSTFYFQNPMKVPKFAVQFVQQINYGPVEIKRYFIPAEDNITGCESGFLEITEKDLIIGNFQKLNTLVCLSDTPYALTRH
jgi:hypothetical protein